MKTYNLILSIALMAFIAVACSTTNSSDNYFGYTNNPKQVEEAPAPAPQQTAVAPAQAWTNPMAAGGGAPVQEVAVRSEDLRRNDYNYNQTVYVPVIVPWWSNHYGWVSTHHYSRRHYHLSSGYWGVGWYSPWYDYHPYHGRYWDPWAPWYSRGWYSQPVYAYSNSKPNKRDTYRSFGANRGSYTYDDRNVRGQSAPRPSGQSETVSTGSAQRVSGTSSPVRSSSSDYNRTEAPSSSPNSVRTSGSSNSVRPSGTQTRSSGSSGNVFRVVETEARPASEPTRTSGGGVIRNVGETQASPTRTSTRPSETAPTYRNDQPSSSGSSAPASSPGSVRSTPSSSGSSSGESSRGSSSGSSRSGSSSGSGSGQRTR
jgi:hypothetical protein